jgi:hypothetical protein
VQGLSACFAKRDRLFVACATARKQAAYRCGLHWGARGFVADGPRRRWLASGRRHAFHVAAQRMRRKACSMSAPDRRRKPWGPCRVDAVRSRLYSTDIPAVSAAILLSFYEYSAKFLLTGLWLTGPIREGVRSHSETLGNTPLILQNRHKIASKPSNFRRLARRISRSADGRASPRRRRTCRHRPRRPR